MTRFFMIITVSASLAAPTAQADNNHKEWIEVSSVSQSLNMPSSASGTSTKSSGNVTAKK